MSFLPNTGARKDNKVATHAVTIVFLSGSGNPEANGYALSIAGQIR